MRGRVVPNVQVRGGFGATLRPIAVLKTAGENHAVPAPLELARPHGRHFTGGPPRVEVTRLVAADSGTTHPADPPRIASRLPYPRPRDEPLRDRAEVMEAGEDFDQTGFEGRPHPAPAADDQTCPATAGPIHLPALQDETLDCHHLLE